MKIILLFICLISLNLYANVDNLSNDELIALQKQGVTVIDIRTPEEWSETGTIPNSHKIMFFDQQRKARVNEFMLAFEKIVTDKNQSFVLVCRTGSRTKAVTNFLDQKLGYTKTSHLTKGIKNWIAESHLVEKSIK